jgi:hypothetical protein
MKTSPRIALIALAFAAALPVAAQRAPASTPPRTSGPDIDTAAENAIRADAAADAAETTAAVDETTDEAEAPLRPARVGQVSVEDVESADALPPEDADAAAAAALDSDGDGIPDDEDADETEREEQ